MLENIYNVEGGEWDYSTFLLYLGLSILSFIIGRQAQNSKVLVISTVQNVYRPKKHINYFWYLLLFGLLFIFLAFRDVGSDLPTYREIFFYSNTDYSKTYGIEPGFVLLNKIIRLCTSDETIGIMILSLLSILFVYKIVEYYADNIDLSLSLFAFVSMFYFQSFNLLRIYMVSYFLCFMFRYILNGKILKYCLCVLCCVLFHYSSILMLLPVFYYYVYCRSKKLFWLGILLLIVGFVISLQYLSVLNVFERYSSYMNNEVNDSLGFGQISFHLPLFLLYFHLKKSVNKTPFLDLFFVYTLFSLIYGMMGYKILMIGRVSVYFIVIYVILIPSLLRTLKENNNQNYYFIKFLYILYIFFRLHMYFTEYLYLDKIMPYKSLIIF